MALSGAPRRAAASAAASASGLRPLADTAMTTLLRRWPTLRLSAIQLTNRIGRFQWDGMFDLVDAHIARACWSNRQLLEVMSEFWENHLHVAAVGKHMIIDRDGLLRRMMPGRA